MKIPISKFTGTLVELKDFKDTVNDIIRLADTYWKDLLEPNKFNKDFTKFTIPQFFEFVKAIPYVPDPVGIEFLSRPKIILALANSNYPLDCDDRTILTRSFLRMMNQKLTGDINKPFIPRVKVTGRKERPHHVFTIYEYNGETIPFDPTYPKNEFGKELFKPGFEYVK